MRRDTVWQWRGDHDIINVQPSFVAAIGAFVSENERVRALAHGVSVQLLLVLSRRGFCIEEVDPIVDLVGSLRMQMSGLQYLDERTSTLYLELPGLLLPNK